MGTTKKKLPIFNFQFPRFRISAERRGFALIELLISIGIVSLLIALFITNFDRATASNRLAEDAELIKSKIEQARLLAGSTQITDEPAGSSGDSNYDPAGYYGLYMPKDTTTQLQLVRVPYPAGRFTPGDCFERETIVIGGDLTVCLVETIVFNRGVEFTYTGESRIIAFRVPTQQYFTIIKSNPPNPIWIEWTATNTFTLRLTPSNKKASIVIKPTGKVDVLY